MRLWVSHAFGKTRAESLLVPEEFGSAGLGPFVEVQQTKEGVPSYFFQLRIEAVELWKDAVALVFLLLVPVATVHQSCGVGLFPHRRVVKRELSRTKGEQRQFLVLNR